MRSETAQATRRGQRNLRRDRDPRDAPTAPILERETRYEEQTFIAKLNYSTIPLFMKKEFPVPMNFYVGYRNKFAGNNNAFKTQYIQTGLSIYF